MSKFYISEDTPPNFFIVEMAIWKDLENFKTNLRDAYVYLAKITWKLSLVGVELDCNLF